MGEDDDCVEGEFVHQLAARKRIQDLEESTEADTKDADALKAAIIELGTRHRLASSHTSFVGVDPRGSQDSRFYYGLMQTREVANQMPRNRCAPKTLKLKKCGKKASSISFDRSSCIPSRLASALPPPGSGFYGTTASAGFGGFSAQPQQHQQTASFGAPPPGLFKAAGSGSFDGFAAGQPQQQQQASFGAAPPPPPPGGSLSGVPASVAAGFGSGGGACFGGPPQARGPQEDLFSFRVPQAAPAAAPASAHGFSFGGPTGGGGLFGSAASTESAPALDSSSKVS